MTDGTVKIIPVNLGHEGFYFTPWLLDMDLLEAPDDTPAFMLIYLPDFTSRQAVFRQDVLDGIAETVYMDEYALVIRYADWASLRKTVGVDAFLLSRQE